MPIYTVANKKAEPNTNPRLVRASNRAQALKHVAEDFTVDVPSQDDLVKFVTAGVAVEDARDAGAAETP